MPFAQKPLGKCRKRTVQVVQFIVAEEKRRIPARMSVFVRTGPDVLNQLRREFGGKMPGKLRGVEMTTYVYPQVISQQQIEFVQHGHKTLAIRDRSRYAASV